MKPKSRVQVGDVFKTAKPLTDGSNSYFKILTKDNLEGGTGSWETGRIAKWSESAMLDSGLWMLVKRHNHTICARCNPIKPGPKFSIGYRKDNG